MEYKLYNGYILGPGTEMPAYGIYEVEIFKSKGDVEASNVWHTSESEWEAQLWIDRQIEYGASRIGWASQADVDQLNKKDEPSYYMITPSGFDIAAVLAVFWNKLKYTSPTEVELTKAEILSVVEMDEERKKQVADILKRMESLSLIDKYSR